MRVTGHLDRRAFLGIVGTAVLAAAAEPRRECVILVHGLGRRKSSMRALQDALEGAGFTVVNWDYTSTRQSIEESAKGLYECYALNAKHYARIHFVTHSLGGIVVRCMLKQFIVEKLGRIVMLAPPNQGSAVARLLLNGPLKWATGPAGQELKSKAELDAICATPTENVLIIAGTKSSDIRNPVSWVSQGTLDKPNDGTVAVAETRLDGVDNLIQIDASHTTLPSHPAAIAATVRFIEGREAPEVTGKEQETFDKGLNVLRMHPERVKEVIAGTRRSNVPLPTLGGTTWWADLVVVDGWRVQQNVLMGNCRLLDPGNVRQAWGSKREMLQAFEALLK